MKKQALEPKELYYSSVCFGDIFVTLYSSVKGLVWLDINIPEEDSLRTVEKKLSCVRPIKAKGHNDNAIEQLKEYFDGSRSVFDLPLDLIGTDFQKNVWRAMLEIPYGKTASYKDIAIRVGNPKATRAVGMANNKNKIAVVVPCHRIIGTDGRLVGYAGGLHIKERLLLLEGVKLSKNKVVV